MRFLKSRRAPGLLWYPDLAFAWLVVAMGMGVALRLSQVIPFPDGFVFRNWVHGHSHVALLGWVMGALWITLLQDWMPHRPSRGGYPVTAMLFQISLLGMVITFPMQGYGSLSIPFSTLYIVVLVPMAIRVMLQARVGDRSPKALLMLRYGLGFAVFSHIGPFVLAFLMAKDLGHTHWYPNAVYFYLHFLCNGGFFLIVLANLWPKDRSAADPWTRLQVHGFAFSTILAFFHAILWMNPHPLFHLIGAIGSLGQLWLLLAWYPRFWNPPPTSYNLVAMLLRWLWMVLLIKQGAQLLANLPAMAAWIHQFRPYVGIAYLHWVMLGWFTPILLYFLYPARWHTHATRHPLALYAVLLALSSLLLTAVAIAPDSVLQLPIFPILSTTYLLMLLSLLTFRVLPVFPKK
jgi:hypothetical protein